LHSPGRPLDPDIRAEMEARFSRDFGDVRIHTDAQAAASARAVNAQAYTVGHDVVFAEGRYSPQSRNGAALLSHELAHVIQQERGGVTPEVNPHAVHEHDADAAARTAVTTTDPVTVQGATGVGLARTVEDWLESTPDIHSWSYTQLLDDIDKIQQWLGYQTTSTPESARLEEALAELQAEARSREKSARRRPKRGRRRRRSRSARTQQAETTQDEQELQSPRILRERTSVQYQNDNEVRQEIDRIMAWLRRDDLSRDERAILQQELQNLSPSLQESRIQRARERRASKIQHTIGPEMGDANQQLIESARRVDGIQPMSERPGFYMLAIGDELIQLHESEVQEIRQNVQKQFLRGVRKIRSTASEASDRYRYQQEINEDQPVVAFFVQTFGNIDDPGVELRQDVKFARANVDAAQTFAQRGRFERAAGFLINAGESAAKANLLSKAYVNEIISTAEMTVSVLELTRDLSFSIAIGIGAALAAPVVFGAATTLTGGAGLTGVAATGTAAVGTGTVVVGGGALAGGVLRGGSNVAGQALTGDVNLAEAGREFTAGAKQGTVAAATGVVSAGAGNVLGQGVTTTGRIVRGGVSGFAGGATGGGAEAALEGKSATEVLEAAGKGGLSGTIGGALGGASSRLLSSRSAVTRVLAGTGTGALGGAAGAYVTGGSLEDIKRAAVTGAITSGVTSAAAPPTPSLRQRQRGAALRRTANANEAKAANLERRATKVEATRPDRAARMRQRAAQLRQEAASQHGEAQGFLRGSRSATVDLPGPEDIDQLFAQVRPQGEITGPTEFPPRLAELDPAQVPRLVRPLERGPNGGRIVYRVEGGGSKELVNIAPSGQVKINPEKGAFLNFGSRARAEEFLQKRGPGARIVAFEVDEQWVRSLRSAAMPEEGTGNISGPKLVDVRFAEDQLYIPPDLVPELQDFVIPGSGQVVQVK
ncbi:MAG: DUF4157 domain-containing protein, partial [Anaerolineae bacterium]|nr:DUF4157 domain-containing protein [Anaerolineae bacterium]